MLRRFGFLRRAADPQHVGIMHQLVQKAVRQHVMAPASACGVPQLWVPWLVQTTEAVLFAAFQYDGDDIDADQGRKQWLRMLSTCVERWCTHWSDGQSQRLAAASLLKHMRGLLLCSDGHSQDALQCWDEVRYRRMTLVKPQGSHC